MVAVKEEHARGGGDLCLLNRRSPGLDPSGGVERFRYPASLRRWRYLSPTGAYAPGKSLCPIQP